ncbi:puative glutaredoxin [Mycobacterium phage Y10]|uniref:Puative glutaredoxin n=1 Tax=Mycobacterium phage Y10 TaxID=2072010 RepID=A0A2Z5XAS9_9CAUD|nr:NrdH-like glutaredoxin [Mycobacterium phage JF1]USH45349.1 NrdH-like glutaredoxin [Mycobacterium phage Ruthiejr]BBC43355.1 puative glutaredoxin [Mycobacterium phage Y10]BBC43446.1 puative glutaredoxin [Mycobacterium phage Y2]BBC43537.1 puative glutaredoxin [Mycobacterium phage Y10]
MTAPAVTVYTTGPQCMKCTLTKRALSKAGIGYKEVRLDQEPETLDQLRQNGYDFTIAPLVIVEFQPTSSDEKPVVISWSDFRREEIENLAESLALNELNDEAAG